MESWKKLDDTDLIKLEKISKGIITVSKAEANISAVLDLGQIGKFKFEMAPYTTNNGIYKLVKQKEYYIYYKQAMKDGNLIDMQLPFSTEQTRQEFIDSKLDDEQKSTMKLVEKEIG